MTLSEFKLLSEDEQYNAIWKIGIHLDSLIIKNDRIVLYSINRFFVEVYYDNVSNEIIKNKTFKLGKELDKYSTIKTSF